MTDATAGNGPSFKLTINDDGSAALEIPLECMSHLSAELLPQLAMHFAKVAEAWQAMQVGQGATSQSLVPMEDGRQALVRIRVDVRDNRGAQAPDEWWKSPPSGE